MSIKKKDFSIDPQDVFAGDKLRRKSEVENIGNLLVNLPSPLTMSINSPWGTGKTAFSKMLQGYLITQGKQAFYFSAWETDFATDPLTAFLGEMTEQLSSYISEDTGKNQAWKKAKNAGSYLARKAIPAVVKIGTASILDINEFVETVLSETAEDLSNDALSAYLADKALIATFKENISKVVGGDPDSSVFVFIDELDRCRPSYAIELLERIKHLLNIEGLTFILAMDGAQLSHSIQALYGINFNARGYLKRFVDIEYNLRDAEIAEYARHLLQEFGLDDWFEKRQHRYSSIRLEKKHILETLEYMSRAADMSLRDLEQIIAKLKLVYMSTHYDEAIFAHLTTFLISVQHKKPDFLRVRENARSIRRQLSEELSEMRLKTHDPYSRVAAIIEAHITLLRLSNEGAPDSEALAEHHRIVGSPDSDQDQLAYSALVIEIHNGIADDIFGNLSFEGIYSKIDMLSNFNLNR